jgi:hypothetical protein
LFAAVAASAVIELIMIVSRKIKPGFALKFDGVFTTVSIL